jgi:hypothetical protein
MPIRSRLARRYAQKNKSRFRRSNCIGPSNDVGRRDMKVSRRDSLKCISSGILRATSFSAKDVLAPGRGVCESRYASLTASAGFRVSV